MIVKFVVLLLLFKASNIRCNDDDVEDMKKKIPGSVAYNCETNATTKEYVCTEPKRRCKEKCSDNVSCCPEGNQFFLTFFKITKALIKAKKAVYQNYYSFFFDWKKHTFTVYFCFIFLGYKLYIFFNQVRAANRPMR